VPLTFPFAGPPEPGESIEILPGIRWLRLPLPLKLDHVNVWMLEDGEGLTVVDTGVADGPTVALWAGAFRHEAEAPEPGVGAPLRRTRIDRLLVTHHHPDHCGLADRLCEEHGAELLMSGQAHDAGLVLNRLDKGTDARSTARRLARHGLPPAAQDFLVSNESEFAVLTPGLPPSFTALVEGETVRTGGYSWRVIYGQGHAPDHVCLYCAEPPAGAARDAAAPGRSPTARGRSAAGRRPGILISGDMVLPHISTHVGSPAAWLPGNPVAQFQKSARRLADLPEDTLVLPSHGEPFIGLRERVAELEVHHQERCRTIAGALGEPRTAAELLQVVFQRELDPLQLMLAMNEAVAHLEYMTDRGELERLQGDDGIIRYVRTGTEPGAESRQPDAAPGPPGSTPAPPDAAPRMPDAATRSDI
jgi:glyoxylase-like metal-dependent hydrolase (beta-lactamase superfamily II)